MAPSALGELVVRSQTTVLSMTLMVSQERKTELTKLVHKLDTAAAKFGMEISAEQNEDNEK